MIEPGSWGCVVVAMVAAVVSMSSGRRGGRRGKLWPS